MSLIIPVAHDFICPWCWVGLLQVNRLKEEFPVDFEVRLGLVEPQDAFFHRLIRDRGQRAVAIQERVGDSHAVLLQERVDLRPRFVSKQPPQLSRREFLSPVRFQCKGLQGRTGQILTLRR